MTWLPYLVGGAAGMMLTVILAALWDVVRPDAGTRGRRRNDFEAPQRREGPYAP